MNKKKLPYMLITIVLFAVFAMAISVSAHTQDVIVSIQNVNLDPEGTKTVPILIENVTDFCSGTIELIYSPGIVEVQSVSPGDYGSPFHKIDNVNGTTRISVMLSDAHGPAGDIRFADLTLKAVGSPGDTSPLDLIVVTLAHSDGTSIQYAISTGTFSISDDMPPSVVDPIATPDLITADGTEVSTLTVHVTDDVSGISSVTVDLSTIGGPSSKPMTKALFPPGSDTYTTATTAASGTLSGTYCLFINATDKAGHSNTTECITLNVAAPAVRGDLNGDNHITPADAAIALQLTVTGGWDSAADVDGDNHITSLDALMILQAAADAITL
jgi:hypothetical protein